MNQALSVRGRGPGYSEALAPLLSYATKNSPVYRPKSSIGGSFLPYFIPIIQMNVYFICRYSELPISAVFRKHSDPVLIKYASACIYRTVHFVPLDSLGCQKQQGWTNMDRVSII